MKTVLGYMTTFHAAHKLSMHTGKCKNLHGHTYRLLVEVEGHPNYNRHDPSYGMIIDFKELKQIVEGVVEKVDHTYLNDSTNTYPTAEFLCRWIWGELHVHLEHILKRVRLWETDHTYAEFRARG